MAVDVLNQNLGISTVLPAVTEDHLPALDNFNTVGSSTSVASVEQYKTSLRAEGFNRHVSSAFAPILSSDELLQPAKLNANLRGAFDKLSELKDDAVIRRFVREDLAPLMENTELLQAYVGMMVEG